MMPRLLQIVTDTSDGPSAPIFRVINVIKPNAYTLKMEAEIASELQ
jgi:hypothetical protein